MTANAASQPDDPQQAMALARLQQRFVAGLPGRWALIASPDPAVRDQALHQLAGAAGAYGLDALGNAARQAEQCAAASNAPSLAIALASLHDLLQGLLQASHAPDVAAQLAEQPHGQCSN